MANKKPATLRAVPRAAWSPIVGRAFAQVGPHQVVCCETDSDIAGDAEDAAELAHRWNAYPHLVAALERAVATGNVRNAVEALANIKKRPAFAVNYGAS